MRKSNASLALVLLVAAGSCLAADGVLEINQDCVAAGCFAGDTAGTPVTLPASGRYRLTSNLTGGSRIVFGPDALDVDLDLNGYTIDGGGRCTGFPANGCGVLAANQAIALPLLAAGTYYYARIHDGTIRGWSTALNAFSLAGGSGFERMWFDQNGGAVSGTLFLSKGEPGSTVTVSKSRFTRNLVDGYASGTTNGDSFVRTVLSDNVFSGNGGVGARVYQGSTLTGNRFDDNSDSGFACATNNGSLPGTAVGGNTLLNNKPSLANTEYQCANLRDMGGNVCADNACP
jgi:hypothetical protein